MQKYLIVWLYNDRLFNWKIGMEVSRYFYGYFL